MILQCFKNVPPERMSASVSQYTTIQNFCENIALKIYMYKKNCTHRYTHSRYIGIYIYRNTPTHKEPKYTIADIYVLMFTG